MDIAKTAGPIITRTQRVIAQSFSGHDHYGRYPFTSLLSVYPAIICQYIPMGDVIDITDMTGYFDSSFSDAAGRRFGAGSPSAPTAHSRDCFSAELHWQLFTQLLYD